MRIGTKSASEVLAAYGFQQSSSSAMDSQSKRDLIAKIKKARDQSGNSKKEETFAEVLEHLYKR